MGVYPLSYAGWPQTFLLSVIPAILPVKDRLLSEVCQSGLDLGMDGFMIETHCNPDKALSDAAQQITPLQLADIIESLETRSELIDDQRFIVRLEELRGQIDKLDHQLLDVLRERVKLVESISDVKAQNQVKIFQMKRWFKILENREKYGSGLGLDPHIVHELFQLVHKYSIDVQIQAQQKEGSLK